jgi:hypothetical protein
VTGNAFFPNFRQRNRTNGITLVGQLASWLLEMSYHFALAFFVSKATQEKNPRIKSFADIWHYDRLLVNSSKDFRQFPSTR